MLESFFELNKILQHVFSCCKIFKNTYVEEHLVTAASELTLESDCLELCFWIVTLKTILAL